MCTHNIKYTVTHVYKIHMNTVIHYIRMHSNNNTCTGMTTYNHKCYVECYYFEQDKDYFIVLRTYNMPNREYCSHGDGATIAGCSRLVVYSSYMYRTVHYPKYT